jgi:bifunctional DNA-binding transcriptional regulator/antitoxin component of YhaV-PrlF toxin-antitoxin module
MAIVTVSEDGNVTIPETILEKAGIAVGDKVNLVFNDKGELVIRKAGRDWRELRGIFKRPGQRPISVEEMNGAIGRFHAEENERILRDAKK